MKTNLLKCLTLLLLSTTLPATINGAEFVLSVPHNMTMEWPPPSTTNAIVDPNNGILVMPAPKAKASRFNVSCPHCGSRFKLTPLTISTNSGRSVPGGNIVERSMTFACPRVDCAEEFTAKNEKFVQETIATEDEPKPIRQAVLPPLPRMLVTNVIARTP